MCLEKSRDPSAPCREPVLRERDASSRADNQPTTPRIILLSTRLGEKQTGVVRHKRHEKELDIGFLQLPAFHAYAMMAERHICYFCLQLLLL